MTAAAAATAVSFRTPVLPWTISSDDEARFRRITGRVLLICAVIFIAMPWLPVFKPDPAKAPELAAPMARLLIEQAKIPPPPPPVAVKAQPETAKPELVPHKLRSGAPAEPGYRIDFIGPGGKVLQSMNGPAATYRRGAKVPYVRAKVTYTWVTHEETMECAAWTQPAFGDGRVKASTR